MVLIILSYLLGSFPSALLAGKRKNIDIRQHGSGNLGGTNTFRVLGKKAGFLVSITDLVKGALATLIGLLLVGPETGVLCGIAASLGHSYPVFAGFRGGKSVATGGGVLLVLSPWAVLSAFAVFIVVLYRFRYVSLASICTALAVILFTLLYQYPLSIFWGTLIIALFVIYRHKANITRLLNGTEKKVMQKK